MCLRKKLLVFQVLLHFPVLHRDTVGIITFAPDGTVQTFNKAAQQVFGYTEEEVIGCDIPHLIPVHDQDDGNVARYLREFIATRATDYTLVIGQHKNGNCILLQISTGKSGGGTDVVLFDDAFAVSPATATGPAEDVMVCFPSG